MFKKRQFLNNKMCEHLTGLLQGVSRSTSGAIHPSVPGIPDRKEKLVRPSGIFLQSPKSEMRARTRPSALGPDRRMFLGFRSRWTKWRDDGERRRNFFRKMDVGEEEEEGRITILLSLFQWWTASYLCWVSGGVRGHTSSVPADLQDSAQESRMDPLHTAENTEKHLLVWLLQGWDASNNIRSHLTRLHSTDLLQGRSTQLDGDVSEEAVSFCAEVSDDVRVCVRSSEELHLTFCYLETLRQDSLHCNITSIKLTPKVTKGEGQDISCTVRRGNHVVCW